MTNQPDIFNFLQQGIKNHLNQMGEDAQLGRELKPIFEKFLYESRGLEVWPDANHIWHVEKAGLKQFQSVSYAACVEWALKQPMKPQEP